jgi:hypothetical protein
LKAKDKQKRATNGDSGSPAELSKRYIRNENKGPASKSSFPKAQVFQRSTPIQGKKEKAQRMTVLTKSASELDKRGIPSQHETSFLFSPSGTMDKHLCDLHPTLSIGPSELDVL